MRHVPVIRGLNLQGKTCAEALGYWVCRGFYFVLKWGFQNKIIFVNVLERLSNKRAKKKHLPQGHFPKTGTLHARSGARTLDTLIKSQVLYQLS